MRAIGRAPAIGIAAATAVMVLVPASAGAAAITRTYAIEAAGFAPLSGSTPAPADPVQISLTVTFDNAANVPDRTAGIALQSSNLALGSTLGFSYLAAIDSLFVGGVQNGVGGTAGSSDDWTVLIAGASTSDPEFTLLSTRPPATPWAGSPSRASRPRRRPCPSPRPWRRSPSACA